MGKNTNKNDPYGPYAIKDLHWTHIYGPINYFKLSTNER